MTNYKIISDSSSDIPKDLVNKYDIEIVPYYVSFNAIDYFKDGLEINTKEFYDKIVNEKVFPKTSFPTIQDFYETFVKYLESDQDIICFSLSSKFSGAHQAILNAKAMAEENFPNRKIEVIDSKNATMGEGLAVIEAAKMKIAGYDFENVVSTIRKIVEHGRVILTVDTLEYLQRGGRIGRASALAGSLLNIKPIIMLKDGELFPHSKVRGRKKAIGEVINITLNSLIYPLNDYVIIPIHSTSFNDVTILKNKFTEQTGYIFDLDIAEVGVTIGTHIGPTACALSFIPKYQTAL